MKVEKKCLCCDGVFEKEQDNTDFCPICPRCIVPLKELRLMRRENNDSI